MNILALLRRSVLATVSALTVLAHAQELEPSPVGEAADLVPVERKHYDTTADVGPHHRVHVTLLESVLADGSTEVVTNRYVELASGLNYFDGTEWKASKEEIEIFEGGAIARQGQHTVTFAPTLNVPGAIDMVTPDGKRMRSNVLGLSYYDAASGRSVLLAEIKESPGQVVGANQVVYPDTFTDLRADAVFTYRKGGFEQDIVLRDNPPPPEAFELDPATTRLEVLTEFIEFPEPARAAVFLKQEEDAQKRATMVAPDFVDERLEFGSMSMVQGRAFSVPAGEEAQEKWTPTGKQFVQMEGRWFLVEGLPYDAIKPELEKLEAKINPGRKERIRAIAQQNTRNRGQGRLIPARRMAQASPGKGTRAMMVAKAQSREPGFVVDYQTVNSIANMVFYGDQTYVVDNAVTLTGTNYLEGGAVIKFARYTAGNYVAIEVQGPLYCYGSAYRPTVFTAKDDNTVGEVIAGSSGNPTNRDYGYRQLWCSGNFNYEIKHVVFRYAHQGLLVQNVIQPAKLRHAQFFSCYDAFCSDSSTLNAHNVLIADCTTALRVNKNYTPNGVILGEHVTVNKAGWAPYYSSPGQVDLKNSLMVEVTTLNAYNNIAGTVQTASSSSAVFATVGAGGSYLQANSGYRNIGTLTIDSQLASDLKRLTTYPPLLIQAGSTISVDTVLNPVVARNTGIPDLGYHYDPLDYLVSQVTVQNATIILTNGVAIGTYGTRGFYLGTGGKLVSQGLPTQPNRLGHLRRVQEQASTAWSGVDQAWLSFSSGGPPKPSLRLIHTDLSVFGTAYDRHLAVNANAYESSEIFIQDCYLRGPLVDFYNASVANALNVTLRNNLCERINFNHNQNGTTYKNFALEVRNNTFYGGALNYTYGSAGVAWTVKDNLFNNGSFVTSITASPFNASHNAYRSGLSTVIPNESGAITVTNMDFVKGPMRTQWELPGNYYYQTSGGTGSLSTLFDAGSRSASDAGLYHHTVRVDQAKDTGLVAIGFHYVAFNGSHLPADGDNDGLPDYLEDANGNGSFDSGAGETAWNAYNGSVPGPTGLLVFTLLK
jgi:hypothetical protein